MGWSIGYDEKWKRDIGYGVPSICDHPKCNKEINRGLSHVCGGEPYGGECGCGLFFCDEHLCYVDVPDGLVEQLCDFCADGVEINFKPKLDVREWIEWKLTHDSWKEWRDENQEEVKKMMEQLNG